MGRRKRRGGRKRSRGGKFWIQKAIKKPGALSRQLGIPVKKNIPKTLLEKIKSTKIGTKIRNPTKTGKRVITVTRLLKRRATLALTLRRLRKKRR